MGSIGLGDSWTPVMCKLRLAEVDPDVRWRLRNALKEDARGAAIVPQLIRRWLYGNDRRIRRGIGRSMDGVEDVVVDVILWRVHMQL